MMTADLLGPQKWAKIVTEQWNVIPPVSEHYEKARDIIVAKIEVLVKELA